MQQRDHEDLLAGEKQMSETAMFVTQSQFFTTAFNAAIFDGPFRIYFAQYQEAHALKIYFGLQQLMRTSLQDEVLKLRSDKKCVFIMLYPTDETFFSSFPASLSSAASASPQIVPERLGSDFVIGVQGHLTETGVQSLHNQISEILT
jgi:hypothetical protein